MYGGIDDERTGDRASVFYGRPRRPIYHPGVSSAVQFAKGGVSSVASGFAKGSYGEECESFHGQRISSGGGNYVQAPSWKEAEKNFREALQKLRAIAKTPEEVDALSKQQKLQFLKAYRALDDAYSNLQVYSQFQDKGLAKDYKIDEKTIEEYSGKFNNLKEELKEDNESDDPEVNTAINYELRCYHVDQIDEDYILRLMEATRSDESALVMDETAKNQKTIKEVNEEIARFHKTNPARAEILEIIWKEYQDNPADFVNVLNARVQAKVKAMIAVFAKEWCVDPAALEFFVETYGVAKDPQDKQVNQDALKKVSNAKEYRKTHPNIGLKYWRLLLEGIRKLYIEKLQKLIER